MDLNNFKNPDTMYRPAPFWSWNDKLNEEELLRQIDEMSEKGWGSYFMHSRVGLITGYLSEKWFELINACAEKARETNTYAWLYDEDKWPSGFAGGEVSKIEEFRSRTLLLLKKDELEPNDNVLFEYTFDGIDYLIADRVSALGVKWFNGMCYVDLMNPNAVKKFLEVTHEKYKEHCGKYFGKEIPGIFTDEPCYSQNRRYGDIPTLPWSNYLVDYFKDRNGYNILDKLNELFFEVGDYQKTRYDFFGAASNLFLDSFTKQYYKWCGENNLKLTGHFMAEDNLEYSIQYIGFSMPHYEFMHWPGIDKLGRHVEQTITVKQVTSVSEQLGKERAMCEVFGCIGHQSAFAERKWIADWQAVLGIGFVNHHLSLYSMKGERKRDYPANLFYQQPWWEDETLFSDYIARLSYIAAFGKRDVKLLVIHTIQSAWCEYSAVIQKLAGYDYNKHFQELTDCLIENKIDFHYGDEDMLNNHAKNVNGEIVINDYKYTHILVPAGITLKKSTLELIENIKDHTIFITPVPTRIDGSVSDEPITKGATVLNNIDEAVKYLKDAFSESNVEIADKLTGDNIKKVICCTRIDRNDKIVLVANTDEYDEVKALIKIPESRTPYIIDMATGNIYDVPYTNKNGFICIDAVLHNKGSLAIFFTDDAIDAFVSCPDNLLSGVSFNTHYKTIEKITNINVKLSGYNILPVDDASLYLNNKAVTQDEPVFRGWNEFFYKAEDGTLFKAEYKFNVIEKPKDNVYAVIEAAENLDSIKINGITAAAMRKKGDLPVFDKKVNYLDSNFVKVDITHGLKIGTNVIEIEGKKINNIVSTACHIGVNNFEDYDTTEFESIYIIGNFSLKTDDNAKFSIDGNIKPPDYSDITSSGYPFYAERAELTTKINIPQKGCFIELKDVNVSNVVIKIDNKVISSRYMNPFIFDISDYEGEHEVTLEICSTLYNLMGPNRFENIIEKRFVGPGDFMGHHATKFTNKYTLLPFGIGEVLLVTA